ncbi:contact-dependent inhibition immunity protein BcpI [Burkholderia thailandensis]|uniref:contact-dependent inhibition immunity protein BcpI n=1 Tax=Burkholderia thailandensis TaxID=57975 RepID=UPI001378E0F0|nr:contact-dependent inhibition immunity protein BcpI [Burkholderia thailandensis]MCS6477391.1 contact-dependent inhibition immunity protein BcpI [Burkholderia thailandensis]MCS6511938.1 contact-dependent inhibition immunity protein BcpI [Burkholderia thailandensis]NBD05282.1 contact-dependent inhibition immunity protein BcpI [Burkholderia thailandensis]
MKNEDRCRKISNLVEANKSLLPELLHDIQFRRNKVRIGSVLIGLSRRAHAQAIYEYFVENDIALLKQNMYLAARLNLASIGESGGASFDTGEPILVALLSDNEEVIQKVARAETADLVKYRNDPLSNFSHVYMLQLAIRGDDDQISRMIEKIARNGKKPLRTECAEGRDFYSLLLKSDKTGLESLIQLKHAPLNSTDPIDEDFFSYLGVLEAKLCWRRGIPVEIDHPLIPMELMPVKPLDHYDDVYDFLKPGWVPPPQGLIGRVSRWFKT